MRKAMEDAANEKCPVNKHVEASREKAEARKEVARATTMREDDDEEEEDEEEQEQRRRSKKAAALQARKSIRLDHDDGPPRLSSPRFVASLD